MKKIIMLVSLVAFALLPSLGFAQESGTKTISHDLGSVELPHTIERVVTMDYAVLDILDTLGLEDKVVGVAQGSVMPDYLGKYRDSKYINTGTQHEPIWESIARAKPDVIFIGSRAASHYSRLSRIAPVVFVGTAGSTGPQFEVTYHNTELIGEIFDKQTEAQENIEAIEALLLQAQEHVTAVESNSTLMLMVNGKRISAYSADVSSRYGFIFNDIGFGSALGESDLEKEYANHGNSISFEFISSLNPDYILIIDRALINTSSSSIESAAETFNNVLVNTTSASQNDNIIYVDSPVWYSTAGGATSSQMMLQDIINVFEK